MSIMNKLKSIECVSFTGPRPKKEDKHSFSVEDIMQRLYETIIKLIVEKGVTTFISGGALGFDQYAFQCVLWIQKHYPHIRNIMAIPFEEQYKGWAKEQIKLYATYKERADEVVYVDELELYQKKNRVKPGKFQGIKYQNRNEFMVDNCQLLVSLYDGNKESGTYNCITYAKEQQVPILNLNLRNQLQYEML